jgi:hypothetical protein
MRAQRFALSCGRVMGRSYAILVGLLGAVAAFVTLAAMLESSTVAGLAIFMTLGAIGWFLGMVTMPVHVTVGEDGLYAWYGAARYYVPIAKIEEVLSPVHHPSVSVVLTNGYSVVFQGEMKEAERMSHALEIVLARRKRGASPESVFARDGRSFADWARGARALVDESAGSYRAAKAPRDLALSHATNEKLPHDVRIGAVLAIAPDATNDEKAALARMIDGVASPTLKRVLANAADGNLDEAEEAHDLYEAERAETKL